MFVDVDAAPLLAMSDGIEHEHNIDDTTVRLCAAACTLGITVVGACAVGTVVGVLHGSLAAGLVRSIALVVLADTGNSVSLTDVETGMDTRHRRLHGDVLR